MNGSMVLNRLTLLLTTAIKAAYTGVKVGENAWASSTDLAKRPLK